jgi:hypothetical protein
MTRGRWTRTLTLSIALTLPISSGILAPTPAFAQEAIPDESESGRPLDGYLLTLLFAGLALFVVGKSARR